MAEQVGLSRSSWMESKRLGFGEAVAAGSAILLLIFMFLPWYDPGIELFSFWDGPYELDGDAWHTLEAIPLVLLLAIIVALGVALLRLTGLGWWSPVPAAAVICMSGCLAAVAILCRIAFPPTFEVALTEGTPKPGIFLALAASCGIAAGGLLAMREEVGSWAGLLIRQRRAGEQEEPGDEDEAGQ